MSKIESALETLTKLQSAAPPITAQKLGDIVTLLHRLEEENELYYARWVEADAKSASASNGDGQHSGSSGSFALTSDLFDNLSTGPLNLPPAPVHPGDDLASAGDVDFDQVFAQILAARPQFDTQSLAGGKDTGKDGDEAEAEDEKNTGVLPKRSTDISHEGTPNADALLQRLPGLMGPTLAAVREHTLENQRVRPYLETALKMMDSVEQIHAIRRGLFSLKPFSFQPKDLIKQARKELLPRAAALDHQILVLADDDLPQMHGDGERAYTILCDLLDNAIRYTPMSGTIRLSADSLGEQILFTVSDSGIGLTEDDLQQIATPFWRAVQQPVVAKQPGAGLRLYIARRMLALMGGELFMSGEPGVGSSFSFTLPIKDS